MKQFWMIVALALALLSPLTRAESSSARETRGGPPPSLESAKTAKISFSAEELRDGAAISYQLARSFLSEKEWDEIVSSMRKKFQDWEQNNEGDMGRYLNDRFIVVALGAIGGDIEKIKKGIVWLALYKEFDQQQPSLVTFALQRHRASLTHLFQDFTWEKASLYIKNKEWRKDPQPKKLSAVSLVDKKS